MSKIKEKSEILKGAPLTEMDKFYIDWGRESVKNNISLANDILKQLITLSTALLGISIIFEKIVTSELLRILVMIFFFLGLIISFIGVLPYEKNVDILSPSEMRIHKIKALKHKLRYLWVASFSLVLGFSLVIAELIIKLMK